MGFDSAYQRQEPGSFGRPDRGAGVGEELRAKLRWTMESVVCLVLFGQICAGPWGGVVCLVLLGDGSASAAVGACIRTLLYANLRPPSKHATRWAPSQCACAAMDSKALNYAQVKSRMSLVLPHEAKKVWSVLQRCARSAWVDLADKSIRESLDTGSGQSFALFVT